MPDISMCKNEKCPLRGTCYRFLAIPFSVKGYGDTQCYTDFAPNKKGECEYYWQVKAGMRVDKALFKELNF